MAKKKNATKRILIIIGILVVFAIIVIVGLRVSGIVGGKEARNGG